MVGKTWNYERVILTGTVAFGGLVTLLVLWQTLTANTAGQRSANAFLLFEMVLGMLVIFVPTLFTRLTKIDIPGMVKIYYWIFLICAVFVGTGLHVIAIIYYWDKILHISSSMLIVAIGYGLMGYFFQDHFFKEISPVFFVIFGFMFGLAGGALWEFYEFSCDTFLGMNLQRFARNGKDLVGQAALLDTMGDLLIDALGSFLFSLFCFFSSKGDAQFYAKFAFRKQVN